ncbi:MAG TPA: ankyrin repeat domain-containing protein [Casimicrobiaceae bacterium]|jgi:hypothetical protein|nr:ankyrin repeat domain-containing protein [Casimicrobiaceae bacterium]
MSGQGQPSIYEFGDFQLDSMKAGPQSQSHRYLQPSIGTALLYLAFGTFFTAPVVAADREALYGKAETLIRYTDDVKGLRALIAQGVDVKRPSQNSQGRTLLTSAATEGKIAMMDVLIKAGADPNAKDESGMTALRHVAWTGKNPVAATRRLIAAKADVLQPTTIGHR